MKRLAALALLMLLAVPAMAQDVPVETVTAHGSSLAGVWSVGRPAYIGTAGFFSPFKWGPERQHYCRIAPRNDDLAMFCFGGMEVWTITIDGSHLHFASGSMLLRLVLDGELQDMGHFRGRFQIKVSGIAAESPAFYNAAHVLPDADGPDHGGKIDLMRRILEQGFAGIPQDGTGRKNGIAAPPHLGAVPTIAYVGKEAREFAPLERGGPSRPYDFIIYLVSFADGQRLCGLHQRDDGAVDDFGCA